MTRSKFKVNDIVLSYYKGLWRIIDIEKRPIYTPILTLEKIATKRMMPCKRRVENCDEAWCKYPLLSTLEYAKQNGVII